MIFFFFSNSMQRVMNPFDLIFLWMLMDGSYDQSMAVLKHAKTLKGMVTKTSIMLGLGERDEEIKQTMLDLRAVGVDIFTLGQYLQVR